MISLSLSLVAMGKKEPKVKRKWVHVAWWCSKMVSNMMMMMMTVRVCLVVDVLRMRGCDWWCSLYFIEDWKFHKCLTPSHWPFIHLTFPSSYDMIWYDMKKASITSGAPCAKSEYLCLCSLTRPFFRIHTTQLPRDGLVYTASYHNILSPPLFSFFLISIWAGHK